MVRTWYRAAARGCLVLLVLCWSCSGPRRPQAEAPAVAPESAAPSGQAATPPTTLRVVGASAMTQVLLGDPTGGGMMELRPAQAPEGSVFLLVSFASPAPAGTKPSLEGARGVKYELRQYMPPEGDGEAVAIFEVAGSPATLTLRHGEFSAEVPLKASDR
jgi:hypothetical protein